MGGRSEPLGKCRLRAVLPDGSCRMSTLPPSGHLPLAGPRLSRWGVVLVVARGSSAAVGVKGGRRPSRKRSRSDPWRRRGRSDDGRRGRRSLAWHGDLRGCRVSGCLGVVGCRRRPDLPWCSDCDGVRSQEAGWGARQAGVGAASRSIEGRPEASRLLCRSHVRLAPGSA
jgi:hypothetical protein